MTTPTTFRKKPVEVTAVQWTGENWDTVAAFLAGGGVKVRPVKSGVGFEIETLEGFMRADQGDWIIRGVKGEMYPCKPDIFDATYERGES